MRLSPTLRLVVTAFLLFVGVAMIWWFVGFQIGKGLMDDAGAGAAWRSAYGWREGGVARLLFLAVLSVLALAVASPLQGWARWALLAGLGLGAGLALGLREGALAGIVLYVLAAAAVDEQEGAMQIGVSVVLGLLVSFAFTLEQPFTGGTTALAVVLRDVFYYWPLLLGPHLLDGLLLARLGASR
jgi:hypothetical protein